jgi:hypothetical protein
MFMAIYRWVGNKLDGMGCDLLAVAVFGQADKLKWGYRGDHNWEVTFATGCALPKFPHLGEQGACRVAGLGMRGWGPGAREGF